MYRATRRAIRWWPQRCGRKLFGTPLPKVGRSTQSKAVLSVRIDFGIRTQLNANERRDIDRLINPTLDPLEGILGLREWCGSLQSCVSLGFTSAHSERGGFLHQLAGIRHC
jgi:hypothetical protein